MLARIRRKRFEARILAREIAEVMMGTAVPGLRPQQAGNGRQPSSHIHADQMLRECGVTL